MTERTYQDYCVVTLSHGDEAAELEVEVTFTQTPIIPARLYGPPEDCYPEEGGEREIVSVRPFKSAPGGKCGMVKEICDCPEWLSDMLAQAIDVYALDAEDE
jgi:hypothetical protein